MRSNPFLMEDHLNYREEVWGRKCPYILTVTKSCNHLPIFPVTEMLLIWVKCSMSFCFWGLLWYLQPKGAVVIQFSFLHFLNPWRGARGEHNFVNPRLKSPLYLLHSHKYIRWIHAYYRYYVGWYFLCKDTPSTVFPVRLWFFLLLTLNFTHDHVSNIDLFFFTGSELMLMILSFSILWLGWRPR